MLTVCWPTSRPLHAGVASITLTGAGVGEPMLDARRPLSFSGQKFWLAGIERMAQRVTGRCRMRRTGLARSSRPQDERRRLSPSMASQRLSWWMWRNTNDCGASNARRHHHLPMCYLPCRKMVASCRARMFGCVTLSSDVPDRYCHVIRATQARARPDGRRLV